MNEGHTASFLSSSTITYVDNDALDNGQDDEEISEQDDLPSERDRTNNRPVGNMDEDVQDPLRNDDAAQVSNTVLVNVNSLTISKIYLRRVKATMNLISMKPKLNQIQMTTKVHKMLSVVYKQEQLQVRKQVMIFTDFVL